MLNFDGEQKTKEACLPNNSWDLQISVENDEERETLMS